MKHSISKRKTKRVVDNFFTKGRAINPL